MRSSIPFYLLCLIFQAFNPFFACKKGPDNATLVSYPIADGTFIQDHLVANWNDARWQQELGFLKEAGMHYLVFAPTLYTDNKGISRTIYPGTLPNVEFKYQVDLVENCLRNAQKTGFKVFLGLNFNEKWWSVNFSKEWLFGQMEIGNQLADDLTKQYKERYPDTMYGWYWVWEVDNLNCTTTERQDVLVQALNINLEHLNQITPKMPFMLCPFVNYRVGNSKDNSEMWQYVFSKTHFREGDIFAPQDCVGSGGLELGMVDEWFSDLKQAVKSKPGLLFWSDAETFDQRFWTSAPLDRFVDQMTVENPYVSKIITFAYSHYYSPLEVPGGFHETYIDYVKTGILPMGIVPEPVKNLIVYADSEGGLKLSWQEPKSKDGLAGYYIFKDQQLIGNIQCKYEDQVQTDFQDKTFDIKDTYLYEVCSYSYAGTISKKCSVAWKLKQNNDER